MTTNHSPHAWRPDEVRRKQFTVRFRGLDPNEVRGFLNLLADDLERLHEQVTTARRDQIKQRDDLEQAQDELAQARAELKQARTELQQAQLNPVDAVSDQAVLLLDQAQQLADALIDEGMQSARDLMVAARSHQREIVSPIGDADYGSIGAAAMPTGHAAEGSVPSEIEDVRNFARVAQVQFRAVLEALNEQVNRLGSVSDTDDQIPPVDHDHHASTPMRALNGNGHGYRG